MHKWLMLIILLPTQSFLIRAPIALAQETHCDWIEDRTQWLECIRTRATIEDFQSACRQLPSLAQGGHDWREIGDLIPLCNKARPSICEASRDAVHDFMPDVASKFSCTADASTPLIKFPEKWESDHNDSCQFLMTFAYQGKLHDRGPMQEHLPEFMEICNRHHDMCVYARDYLKKMDLEHHTDTKEIAQLTCDR